MTPQKTYFFINDHLGTPQLLLDKNGEAVWQGNQKPFGSGTADPEKVANIFRFPGQMYDAETGLYYNWNRYYDPDTGRYLNPDPIGLKGGVNMYGYANSNPVVYIDQDG